MSGSAIYGKVECSIASDHGRIHLTVTGGICSIKQGGDLIRLEMRELRALATDAALALGELDELTRQLGQAAR